MVDATSGLNASQRFTFPGDPLNESDNFLPNGNYEAGLRAGGPNNAAGETLAAEHVTPFFVLAGDLNHDRFVNGDDYFIIDSAYPAALTGYLHGDVDYNGETNGDDYFTIDSALYTYGTGMPEQPKTPNSLIAYASMGRGRIDLTWTAPADMTGIAGFRVFRSADGGTYTQIAEIADPAARHWSQSNLGDGKKWYYRVRAYSTTAGNSLTTNEAWAVTNLPGPGELSVIASTATSVNLNFSDNTDDESGFEVWQSANGGAYVLVDSLPANAEQGPMVYQRTGLNPGSTYSFRVRATNSAQTSIFTLRETTTTPGATLSITNSGFEAPVPNPTSDPVPGWTVTKPTSGTTVEEVVTVGTAQFPAGAPQGSKALKLATDRFQTQVSQTLGAAAANTRYEMKVKVGTPIGAARSLGSVHVSAGGASATSEVIELTTNGQFQTITLTFDTASSATSAAVQVTLVGGYGDAGPAEMWFDDVKVTATPLVPQAPHGGTAWAIPGVVEFEDFDDGGEGISYHDTTGGNTGGFYRRSEDTDIDIARDDTGGFVVGWAKASEWLEYTINVPTGAGGTFDLTSYVSSPGDGGKFHWSVDGVDEGGQLTVPNTAGYYTYQPVTLAGIALSEGQHVLRVTLDTAGTGAGGWNSVGNFNYFTLIAPGASLGAPTITASTAPYPNRVDLTWTDTNTNEGTFKIERSADGGTNWSALQTVRANTDFYADTTVSANTGYQYRVRAVNGAITSTWSNVADVTTPTSLSGLPIKINFQVDRTPPESGYLVDSGDLYDARSNGLSYGWNTDHTIQDRERGINSNRLLDTLVHFRQGAQWSIGLPNGNYDVRVSIGDPGYSSTYTINANGVSFWDRQSLAKDRFLQKSMMVSVSDGFLTLDQAAGADRATRVNYIEISAAGSVPVASIAASPSETTEDGPTTATYTILLDRPAPTDLAISFEVDANATTAEVGDYELAPAVGSIVIPTGRTSAEVLMTPQHDADADSEILVLRLVDGANYDVRSPLSANVTIRDDDGAFADLDIFEDFNQNGVHDNSVFAEQGEASTPTNLPLLTDGDPAKLALVLQGVTTGQTVSFSFDSGELALYRDLARTQPP